MKKEKDLRDTLIAKILETINDILIDTDNSIQGYVYYDCIDALRNLPELNVSHSYMSENELYCPENLMPVNYKIYF